ncbi:Hpt domain-containing protein [Hyphomonas sp.]|uniref:Hpt domain-containing protein n=1 Tax=Hyphomonas sp. TaxID=87 RepID=UPI00391C245B
MLGRLLSTASGALSKNRRQSQPLPPPDISRVLKPQHSETATVAALAQAESLGEEAERAIDGLTEQFETWMRRDLEALRSAWAEAQLPEAGAEDYRRLYTCAHNITGAAPSYGYPAVSRLSKSLCTLLSNTKPGENAPLINLHVEACRAAIAAGPEGDASHSVADAVCDALERRVAAKLAG